MTMADDDEKLSFALRIACVGTVDAKPTNCKNSLVLSFDCVADTDALTDALGQAGWYASVCNLRPGIMTSVTPGPNPGMAICPLCPTCAAYLLPKEMIMAADRIMAEKRESAAQIAKVGDKGARSAGGGGGVGRPAVPAGGKEN